MKDKPYFSIIIPVYNRVSSLKRALVSVIQQDFPDFEVIVVDDGSTPQFAQDIARTVNDIGNSKIQLIRYEKNINGAYARNVGIKASTGQYICLLDSDDEWTQNKLSTIYHYTKQNSTQFVYHQCRISSGKVIPSSGIASCERYTEYCFVRNQRVGAPTSTITILRKLALANLFDSSLSGHQDWDFCLRLEKKGIQFDFIDKALCIRHKSNHDSVGQNISFEYSLHFFKERKEFFSVRSASYFHRLTLLPKAVKELRIFSALCRSAYFWIMLLFLKREGVDAIVDGVRKVVAINQRLKKLKRKLTNRDGHIFIYGDNYYGQIVNDSLGKKVVCFLDSSPLRDSINGKPIKPMSYLKEVEFEQVAAIILATDKHEKVMTKNVLENSQYLENKIICF
ncbi:glycosyltransferase family 2 protein [Aliiglaciecola sp. SL4]|uniref:glycosyltransferase family 2 protein n=1 Tax=Aliiglaciecola sp. SL4 TaxID=3239806 RepID=UPI00355BE8E8